MKLSEIIAHYLGCDSVSERHMMEARITAIVTEFLNKENKIDEKYDAAWRVSDTEPEIDFVQLARQPDRLFFGDWNMTVEEVDNFNEVEYEKTVRTQSIQKAEHEIKTRQAALDIWKAKLTRYQQTTNL